MKTFLFPEFLNVQLAIILIAAGVLVFAGIMYWIDRANRNPKLPQQKGFAQATLFLTIAGIIAIAGLTFGGKPYNDLQMAQKVSSDYGVDVLTIKEWRINVLSSKGPLKCDVNSKDQINYYVLCNLPNGDYRPLDEIITDKNIQPMLLEQR